MPRTAWTAKATGVQTTARAPRSTRIGSLLVFGDHDFVRLEHAVRMHGLIPGAQLAILPGTTHMAVMRRADLIVPLVRDFLG